MFLNHFKDRSTDALIQALTRLPSGFAVRTAVYEPETISPKCPARQNLCKGHDQYRLWAENRKPRHLKRAKACYLSAYDLAKRAGSPALVQLALSNVGIISLRQKLYRDAATYFERALELDKELGHRSSLCEDLGSLCETLRCQMICHGKRWGMNPPLEALIRLENLQKELTVQRQHKNAEPLCAEAYLIEQGEIGFSDRAPIGSSNIHDCLCLCLKKQETGKVGLAHFDGHCDPDSLQQLVEGLGSSKNGDSPLLLRIVGARFLRDRNSSGQEGSKANIRTALRALMEIADIEVVSADIGGLKQPTTFVIDPARFMLTEEFPATPYPNASLASVRPFIRFHGGPLRVTLDLTQTQERPPLLIHHLEAVLFTQRFWNKSDADIALWLDENTHAGRPQKECIGYGIKQLAIAFKKSHEALCQKVDDKANTLLAEGVILSDSTRQRAKEFVATAPLYIGEGTGLSNEELGRLIDQKLFVVQDGKAEISSCWMVDYRPSEKAFWRRMVTGLHNG